jgi:hypothetical protein
MKAYTIIGETIADLKVEAWPLLRVDDPEVYNPDGINFSVQVGNFDAYVDVVVSWEDIRALEAEWHTRQTKPMLDDEFTCACCGSIIADEEEEYCTCE